MEGVKKSGPYLTRSVLVMLRWSAKKTRVLQNEHTGIKGL
jgi:hypothetical protein